MVLYFFFFKQKTAYEIRKGDWSSDVCSSDLLWCERREGESRRFRLIVMSRGKTEPRCPLVLEWQGYPGGLSVFSDRRTTLDRFVYVNDPKRQPPPNVRLTENAI